MQGSLRHLLLINYEQKREGQAGTRPEGGEVVKKGVREEAELKLNVVVKLFQSSNKVSSTQNYFVKKHLKGYKNVHVFAIFDGFGRNGAAVSELASATMDSLLEGDFFTAKLDRHNLEKKLVHLFKETQDRLTSTLPPEMLLASGTTCTMAFFHSDHLFLANLGDSKSFLASNNLHNFVIESLSNDHVLSNSIENQRILKTIDTIHPKKELQPSSPLLMFPLTRGFGCTSQIEQGFTHKPGKFR